MKERIRRIVEGHNHHPAQKILRRHLEIYPDTKYKAVVTLAILHCGDVFDFLSHYYGLNPLPAIPIGPTNESAEPVGWVLSAPASSSFQTLATAWHAHGTHSAIVNRWRHRIGIPILWWRSPRLPGGVTHHRYQSSQSQLRFPSPRPPQSDRQTRAG